jgi:AcrR family transcriptional regulator
MPSRPAAKPGHRKRRSPALPLTREHVVRAALKLLDEVGLDGLTVRRLADDLGVQNPALYWHFRDKHELLDEMASTVIGDAFATLQPPADRADWRGVVWGIAQAFRRAMLACRDGARLIAGADLMREDHLAGLDQAVRHLMDAGFTGIEAFAGILAAVHYTIGTTFQQQADPRRAPAATVDRDRGAQLTGLLADRQRLPTLAAIFSDLGPADHGEAAVFDSGLALLIDGLGLRRRGRAGARPSRRG